MNTNVVLAFVGGAVLASGIVYMAVKPETASKPVTQPVPTASAVAPKAPEAAPELPAAPAVETQEKPSPAPPPRTIPKIKPRSAQNAPVQTARVVPPEPVTPAAAPPSSPAPQQAAAPAPAPPPAPEPAPVTQAPLPPLPPPARVPHTVTIPAGTTVGVRLGETLSTKRNQPGDTFLATLDRPLVADGFVIAEKGARVEGRVVDSDPGGRVKGVARLSIELVKLNTADGQHVRIRTSSVSKDANATTGKDAAKVGGGAALGAIIGAIAGGGKGAGIGAGVGGAAGAGDVLLTRGTPAELKVESRETFRLTEPLTITEKLD